MRTQVVVLAMFLLFGCTPLDRSKTALGLGALTCAGGQAASALGQDWGALVAEAGCWLAEWGADRLSELRAKQRMEAARTTDLTPAEEAIVQLAEAHAAMLANPCDEAARDLEGALATCRALAASGD